MSGIVSQIGARSGILDSGGLPSAGTVTQSGTSQLDYEEGTWTPTGTGLSTASGNYTKIGRLVTCEGNVQLGTDDNTSFDGLPFTSKNVSGPGRAGGGVLLYNLQHHSRICVVNESDTTFFFTTLSGENSFTDNSMPMQFILTYHI